MQVADAMTRHVITVTPRTSVMNARRLLHSHGIRHLPVLEGAAVTGMVSDRDVRINDRVLADSLQHLQSDLVTGRYRQIEEIMSTPVHTVGPDATVADAARTMLAHRIGGLPVTEGDQLVGIITLTDCIEALLPSAKDEVLDRDVDAAVPLDVGDERPGRPGDQAIALVVTDDDNTRLTTARRLARDGYRVVTCPGPFGGTLCPGVGGSGGRRCPRVPRDTRLIVLDARAAATGLPDAYHAWAPDAHLEFVETSPAGEAHA